MIRQTHLYGESVVYKVDRFVKNKNCDKKVKKKEQKDFSLTVESHGTS